MEKRQNIYDDPAFFAGYRGLRENPKNYNTLLEHPALEALLPPLGGLRVLDLGCGFGESCVRFLELGAAQVVGIDCSRRMLEVAQGENSRPGIRYLQLGMEELDELEGEFDCVVSSLAIHYVADYAGLLGAIGRKLGPGGVLIFSQEHPLTTAPKAGALWAHDEAGKRSHYILTDYGREGKRRTEWFVDGVEKYHRTFSTLVEGLVGAGFAIERMVEPQPGEAALLEMGKMASEGDKPSFLLFRARKG